MAAASQAASSSPAPPCAVEFRRKQHSHRISFPVSAFLRTCFSRRVSVQLLHQKSYRSCAASWVFPVSEIAVDGSSNAAAVAIPKLDTMSEEDAPQESHATTKEENLSAFMADVANLIKLVDSRDIVELELKHLDYELVLRKKEALTPPAAPLVTSPQVVTQAPYPAFAPPSPAPHAAPSATPTPVPAAVSPPAPSAQPALDSPRILSPMAGTFYKCPAPGEPPFVKVGDKVSKGQVICIVEAMKLMNEIEADQTGTIVEILAEHGKPVSVDTPLFAIKP